MGSRIKRIYTEFQISLHRSLGRLIRYRYYLHGSVIPDRKMGLQTLGEIPLVTAGDTAFPRFYWLLKLYNESTTDRQQKYFHKFFGVRVVTRNAYVMLKGWSRILIKSNECILFNLKVNKSRYKQYGVTHTFKSIETEKR